MNNCTKYRCKLVCSRYIFFYTSGSFDSHTSLSPKKSAQSSVLARVSEAIKREVPPAQMATREGESTLREYSSVLCLPM